MTHLAHHDPLTGLPNRRWLLERLREALRDADAAQRRVALLFIDLDGFKAVNDTHGHAIGDALLRAVAQRLRGRVRAGDTVCRLAGDEFVVLLPSIADREAASDVAALLRAALARPFALRGRVLRVGFSGGIAVAPEDGTRAEVLLERADAAMYEAKRRGRDPAPVRAAH
jgi:diguanylate cyclase (GGDEF)-like protein